MVKVTKESLFCICKEDTMKFKGQRGQAMIIIVFSIIALVAMTGLAVDGGMAFSDRRHAQNAADTAAMAGAMARINAAKHGLNENDALTVAAMNMALQNGYDSNLVSNTVEVYTCNMGGASCGAPYTGDPDYVQVIITSHIDTFFAGVIGIRQMHNRVQAVALAKTAGAFYDGRNIVALSRECENPVNFSIQGTAQVTLTGGGGAFVNTDADDGSCGFSCNSNANSITGNITTAGGAIDFGGQCTNTGTNATDGEQWKFPVTLADMGIEIPPECNAPLGTYTNYAAGTYPGYPTQGVSVLTPGKYSDFPPQKEISEGKLYNQIFMLPGMYCVHHVIKLTDQNLTLIGKDVTFFMSKGYDFSINGGTVKIDAPDSGNYAGYLMIVEPDYGDPLLSEGPLDCTINGNSNNIFEGAVFAPYCNVTITGGSDNNGIASQVIGYTVKIDGKGVVNFSYDSSKNPKLKAQTGMIK
jgi:hypothetical protein